MSEVTVLIAEIKSKGLLRAGDKLEELYVVAARIQDDNLELKAQRDALAAECVKHNNMAFAFQQRAVAAEAKLAELESLIHQFGRKQGVAAMQSAQLVIAALSERPAPAVCLAELVPEEPTRDMLASVEWRSEHKDGLECYRTENIKRIWRIMRPALMRNIEGANK